MRSGLQQDVINLYRQGLRNVYSKPAAARAAFLLHLRYSFHNPRLTKRDYVGIEHQLRRVGRTIETLAEPSVHRLAVSAEMEAWWAGEVARARARAEAGGASQEGPGARREAAGADAAADAGDTGRARREGTQWGGKLPGPGGT